MKKECPICGNIFDNTKGAKFCSDCRTQGKRICTQCGQVFVTAKPVSMCHVCNNNRKKVNRARKKHEERQQKNLQSLDAKAAAARELGMSYGQYSALRRGLLIV